MIPKTHSVLSEHFGYGHWTLALRKHDTRKETRDHYERPEEGKKTIPADKHHPIDICKT
jgi:hypothetical protein